jgi:hypothetical protein
MCQEVGLEHVIGEAEWEGMDNHSRSCLHLIHFRCLTRPLLRAGKMKSTRSNIKQVLLRISREDARP